MVSTIMGEPALFNLSRYPLNSIFEHFNAKLSGRKMSDIIEAQITGNPRG